MRTRVTIFFHMPFRLKYQNVNFKAHRKIAQFHFNFLPYLFQMYIKLLLLYSQSTSGGKVNYCETRGKVNILYLGSTIYASHIKEMNCEWLKIKMQQLVEECTKMKPDDFFFIMKIFIFKHTKNSHNKNKLYKNDILKCLS